ncbi:hypothetical protein DUI87_17656 [Hirundo rustica rustica]|uniref:ribonuclease H n=1 Tax=Hirundo rustica rustica TaxID=333673 RepID=A0A3M0K1C0_HIRRU|nr:hypothetical protein DUI87_17656 [Hirundo rustica rustica]
MLLDTPDWHVVTVDPGWMTNLQQTDSKYLVIGDSKHTSSKIKIAPGVLPSDAEQLAPLTGCVHPPLFLPKGQVIAQAIPLPQLPYDDLELSVYWAEMVGEDKPIIWCGLKREGDFIQLKGMMDTGHIVETTSPWNSLVFVIKKPERDKRRLLHDLHKINEVIEDMGSLQPGMPSPLLPPNWNLAVIDIKDVFFQIPLNPADAPQFAFSVPSINREVPMKRYHWRVLPQGLKNSLSVCQWYVTKILSPVHAKAGEAVILHYMDDVLVCAPDDNVLTQILDETITALAAAEFELQQEKVQRLPPWRYLGLESANQPITPQKLVNSDRLETLEDLHQLCGSLNWVRPWLGLTVEDLAPLFNFLKGEEELVFLRALTQEAQQALERVQLAMSSRQAHRCRLELPSNFIILGKLPHLHELIFQWDKGQKVPLLILEWVFLGHQLSKSITKPQELMSQPISKARVRTRLLAGCEFTCILVPIKLLTGKLTKETLEQLLRENKKLQRLL